MGQGGKSLALGEDSGNLAILSPYTEGGGGGFSHYKVTGHLFHFFIDLSS